MRWGFSCIQAFYMLFSQSGMPFCHPTSGWITGTFSTQEWTSWIKLPIKRIFSKTFEKPSVFTLFPNMKYIAVTKHTNVQKPLPLTASIQCKGEFNPKSLNCKPRAIWLSYTTEPGRVDFFRSSSFKKGGTTAKDVYPESSPWDSSWLLTVWKSQFSTKSLPLVHASCQFRLVIKVSESQFPCL